MQGTAGTSAGSYGEVLLALLYTFLLVGTCNRMLESGRVGGVTGNGNVYALFPHDCNTFCYVICAVAVNLGAKAFGIRFPEYFLQLAGVIVHLSLYISKAVDSGNDLCSILAKTVQDNAQRFLTNLVCLLSNTDSTLCCCKGLMTCQEAEAVCFFFQQHLAQITMAKTYFTLISNGTGDTESLQSFADCCCCVSCSSAAFLDCDRCTYSVSPASVLETDGLDFLYLIVNIQAGIFGDFFSFFDGSNSVAI